MREKEFINKNYDKWSKLEKMLKDSSLNNPDEVSDLFVSITDDLSYAQTFYKNRSVRVYLNGLGQNLYKLINKTRQKAKMSFVYFWTTELPLNVYYARYNLLTSLLVFLLAIGIGVFSTIVDPEFPRLILGDNYVNMTIENIEKGDPLYVYKDSKAFGMSLGITSNNLLVSFWTYFFGLFAGIGTIIILFKNGVMVGAFQFFFYDYGLLHESFLTIFMHGTIELSSIVIAGGAGLTMGAGLIFPKTYSRTQAFSLSAKRGFMIMLGVIPFIIIAGVIESYLTRLTDVPDILRWLFIISNLSIMLFYFVWLPYKTYNRLGRPEFKESTLSPDKKIDFEKNNIYANGQILEYVFLFIKKNVTYFFALPTLYLTIWMAITIILFPIISGSSIDTLEIENKSLSFITSLLGIPFFLMMILKGWKQFSEILDLEGVSSFQFKQIFQLIVSSILLAGTLFCYLEVNQFSIIILPVLIYWVIVGLMGKNTGQQFQMTTRFVLGNKLQGAVLTILWIGIFFLIEYLIVELLSNFLFELVSFIGLESEYVLLSMIGHFFNYLLLIATSLLISIIIYLTFSEIEDATFLKKKIKKLSIKYKPE